MALEICPNLHWVGAHSMPTICRVTTLNVGVPKTLVQYLTRWYAQHRASSDLRKALERVLETPITPELLPVADGEIGQRTEEIIGPFELHDFFLYLPLPTDRG